MRSWPQTRREKAVKRCPTGVTGLQGFLGKAKAWCFLKTSRVKWTGLFGFQPRVLLCDGAGRPRPPCAQAQHILNCPAKERTPASSHPALLQLQIYYLKGYFAQLKKIKIIAQTQRSNPPLVPSVQGCAQIKSGQNNAGQRYCCTNTVVAQIYFILKNVRERGWGRVEENIYQNTRRHLS